MGWTNLDNLQNAHKNCVNAANCPTLTNQPANKQTLIFAAPTEDIGLNGPIAALPGDNPVVWKN